MDAVVPIEVVMELTDILSALVLDNNEIRSAAEKTLNERLVHAPDLFLVGIGQLAIVSDTQMIRSLSFVLLRRLLFRSIMPIQPAGRCTTLYAQLSSETIDVLERILLHSISHEPTPTVRRKCIDVISELANTGMKHGRQWDALKFQVINMTQHDVASKDAAEMKETAYRVLAGCPDVVMDLKVDEVSALFQQGLQDEYSVEVRHAALLASTAYLSIVGIAQFSHFHYLVCLMLNSLYTLGLSVSSSPYPSFSSSGKSNYEYLSSFLKPFITLCASRPFFFVSHLQALVKFLPSLIHPHSDGESTPTTEKPYLNHNIDDISEENEEKQALRLVALEFMTSLTESMPNSVKMVKEWVDVIIWCCLEGMGEFKDEEGTGRGLDEWLAADPHDSSDDETPPIVFESALGRVAISVGGVPSASQHIPFMLGKSDWRSRHAGLMAMAAIAFGNRQVILPELDNIVGLILPLFADPHPRVRYAACQCIGGLCITTKAITQQYHHQLFSVLVPVLEDLQPRVQYSAATAVMNLCRQLKWNTLQPYLDHVVCGLLKLFHPAGTPALEHRYLQELAILSIGVVANIAQHTFAQYYPVVMPWLLGVLQNIDDVHFKESRARAIVCASRIAVAVGVDIFRPDAHTLVELLIRIGSSDPEMNYSLISTSAYVCRAMGLEFEPYLPVIMPGILTAARADADVSVYDEESQGARAGWRTVKLDGQPIEIRTASIEEKYHAFNTLMIYHSVLGDQLAPYVLESLEVCLLSLQFRFHHGVREASVLLIPKLLATGKNCRLLTDQIVSTTFHQLVSCVKTTQLATFVSSVYGCMKLCLLAIGGPDVLPQECRTVIFESAKHQLDQIGNRRKGRRGTQKACATSDLADMNMEHIVLLDQIEEVALQEIEEILQVLSDKHPMLLELSSVRKLATKIKKSSSKKSGSQKSSAAKG